jgi:hypothetical protein
VTIGRIVAIKTQKREGKQGPSKVHPAKPPAESETPAEAGFDPDEDDVEAGR